MGEHPNASLYRRYLEGLAAGDVDTVVSMIAPDVIWHEPGGELAIHGRDALVERMRAVTGGFDVRFDLHDVLANDEHTVALYEMTVDGGGRRLVARVAEVWHVADGAVAERWSFAEDSEAFLRFFTADTAT